jgi:hypothetical protein
MTHTTTRGAGGGGHAGLILAVGNSPQGGTTQREFQLRQGVTVTPHSQRIREPPC